MTEINKPADWLFCSTVGQDSHRFMTAEERALQSGRSLMLAGIPLADEPPLAGNSDADVVLHALTNALSGLTTRNILGRRADILCQEQGITDSSAYLGEALQDLRESGWVLVHLSFSIEAARPRLAVWIDPMRRRLAELTGLAPQHIGLTATSGEGLTAFGRGEGIQVFCLASARCPEVKA